MELCDESIFFENDAIRYVKDMTFTLEKLANFKLSSLLWKGHMARVISEVFETNKNINFRTFCKAVIPELVQTVMEDLGLSKLLAYDLLQNAKQSLPDIFMWIQLERDSKYIGLDKPWNFVGEIIWRDTKRVDEVETARRLFCEEKVGHPFKESLYYPHRMKFWKLLQDKNNLLKLPIKYYVYADQPDYEHLKIFPSSFTIFEISLLMDFYAKAVLRDYSIPLDFNAADLVCLLYSYMNLPEQKKILNKLENNMRCSYPLEILYSDPLWKKHVLTTTLYFYDTIHEVRLMNFLLVPLSDFIFNIERVTSKKIILTILENMTRYYRKKFSGEPQCKTIFFQMVFYDLLYLEEKYMYEIFLDRLFRTPEEIPVHFSNNVLDLFPVQYINSKQFALIHKSLKYFFPNKKDRNSCKQKFLSQYSTSPSRVNDIINERYDVIDCVRAFCKKKGQRLEGKIQYFLSIDILTKLIVKNDSLVSLERHFQWLSDGDEEAARSNMNMFFENETFIHTIITVVFHDIDDSDDETTDELKMAGLFEAADYVVLKFHHKWKKIEVPPGEDELNFVKNEMLIAYAEHEYRELETNTKAELIISESLCVYRFLRWVRPSQKLIDETKEMMERKRAEHRISELFYYGLTLGDYLTKKALYQFAEIIHE